MSPLADADGALGAARADAATSASLRGAFPALRAQPEGWTYLDTASTALRVAPALDAMVTVARDCPGNVERGLHRTARAAAARLAAARAQVARFVGGEGAGQVVFVSGATAALNAVARGWLAPRLREGDEVVVTQLEHHANLLPWRQQCRAHGARLRVAPLDGQGGLDLDALADMLGPRTRMLALAHVSNVLGSVLPVAEACQLARARGVATVVDGAQALAHVPVDVVALGCDFYAASAHKAYGPTGAGFLWVRGARLEELAPWRLGGGMVLGVGDDAERLAAPPARFEAGTPPIEAVVGMAAALSWMDEVGRDALWRRERALLDHARAVLTGVPGVRVLPSGAQSAALLSCVVDGCHPHDLATLLDAADVAVRAGVHCAEPLHRALGEAATLRVSFGAYNDARDVERLVCALARARELLSRGAGT